MQQRNRNIGNNMFVISPNQISVAGKEDMDYRRKERNQSKHINSKSGYLAAASRSGKWFSSQIINDTLAGHNYAQTQRDTDKIFTPPPQRRSVLLTGFATLVALLIRVKEQRVGGIDVGVQVWANHLLLQNMSRLLWRQQVIILCGSLAAALLLLAKTLCKVVWYSATRGLFSVFWLIIQQRLKVSSFSLRLSLCASIFYGFEDEILGKAGEVVFRGLLQLPCHLKCMASISDSLYIKM